MLVQQKTKRVKKMKNLLRFLVVLTLMCCFINCNISSNTEALNYVDHCKKNKHPIDRLMYMCLNDTSNYTTIGMVSCVRIAQFRWKNQIDILLPQIAKELSPPAREAFEESQKKWEEYRDAQLDLYNAFFGNFDGTMYRNINASCHMELFRERVLLLEYILQESSFQIDFE
jgi:hypothetical protein